MNFKSKLRVTKSLARIICLMSITILGIVFQGCEKEELLPSQYYEFLEVNLSVEKYTHEQLAVLEKAKDRIDKYVSINLINS